MSKEKNIRRPDNASRKSTLFQTIHNMAQDPNPQFRTDFFQALNTDLGDLGPIFQAQEDAAQPDRDYINLVALSLMLRNKDRSHHDSGISEPIQFLYEHLPHPVIGNHPSIQYQNLGLNTDLLPMVMVLDNLQFKSSLENPASHEAVSMLLADFIYATERQRRPSELFSPEVGDRVRKLMDKCDPDRVAVHLMRTSSSLSNASSLGSSALLRSEPFAQELSKFTATQIVPRLLTLIQTSEKTEDRAGARKKNAIQEGEVNSVELPEGGATLTLLDARQQLRFMFMNNEVNGAWLNRPQLWAAVRTASVQSEFVSTCVSYGAFEEIKDKKPTVKKEVGNKLLQGLVIPGSEPSPIPDNKQSFQALEGYMESIGTARDLSSVVQALRAKYTQIQPGLSKFSKLISKAAARIGYSPEDAYLMMSGLDWREGPTESSTNMINTLNDGRWTAGQINDVFANRPFVQHDSRHLVALLRTVVDSNPKVWGQFTDITIFKLGVGWAYSGAINMWKDEANYVQPFLARLGALPYEDKVRVFAPMVSWHWKDSAFASEISERFTRDLLATIPDAGKEEFIRQAAALRPGNRFFSDVARYLDSPIFQKEIVKSYAQNYNRGHYGDLLSLGELLGYGSSYDKSTTLSFLPPKIVRHAFTDALYHINNNSRGCFGGFSRTNGKNKSQDINILKNVVFDLHEHLTPLSQTPVELTGRELLVRTGIARRGDLLTWEGFCHLAAPFLEDPRPAVDEKPEQVQPQSDTAPRASSGLVLNKDVLRQKIEQGSSHHGPRPRDFRGNSHFPMHMDGMPTKMVEHFVSNHGWGLPPKIMKIALAQDVIELYSRGEWFIQPKENVEPTPPGGEDIQHKSRPKPGGR